MMWGVRPPPGYAARHIFIYLAGWHGANLAVARSCLALKLLWWSADISFVQRSVLISGLSLALGGLTLLGISEWVAGGFDAAAPDRHSSAAIAAPEFSRNNAGTLSVKPLEAETGAHLPASSPGFTLHRNVPEVRLQFTAADDRGRLVSDLSPSDVEVFDNQSEVLHFNDFERGADLPLQLGLLLDTSDSVRPVLPEEKNAAIAFLSQIMRPETDQALIIGFAGDFKTWQNSTGNRQQLFDAIGRLKEPGWGTRIFDALYAACSTKLDVADARNVHRAVVVLSDGDDTDSLHTITDVIALAQRSETQIYALTIHGRNRDLRGDQILQRLADSTGGRFYVAATARELGPVFAQIEQDLRTQYYVSFPPQQPTPGYHSLRVEARAPRKLQIHARQGYYALAQ